MWTLILRDWRLAARRRVEALLPLVFFIVAASLFPLGVGPEPQTLRTIAPGVVWVCALLASLLSLGSLYGPDFTDGSLEQMLLSGRSLPGLALAKAFAHWTVNGLPLVLASPVLGLLFDLPGEPLLTLVASLLLGTPVLSLLGGVGAALTLGLRSGGMLIVLLVLPLAVPVLIFGAGSVVAVSSGLSPEGHLSLLGALLLLTLLGAPWATAAALKIALD
ncbi:MAG: heme exporter protein CcmB [Aquabacterium sp.]|uniref:heme exporter protein CcmB n=1 Tax=Aquabacterium sp. TaxID=1872578 RepID=UPI0025C68119|nr:heme exporter protein CcmB [Aquabacterium sp.]MBI3382426.1 heme exporter protein CcmB [Aquabacterium sp.]